MSDKYTMIKNLTGYSPVPEAGILSRTAYSDDSIKVVYFGFAAGEELSEHTASMPAIIEIIEGDVQLTLGEDTFDAGPGMWIHMQANLSHSLLAKTPSIMLLTLLKQG